MLYKPSQFDRMLGVVDEPVGVETAFLSRRAASLFHWWQEAGDGVPPKKASFDVTQHPDLIANLFLVEAMARGEFLFRTRGEEVIRLLGGSSRQTASVERLPTRDGRSLADYFQSVLDLGRCRRCRGMVMFRDGQQVAFESIDCPLADHGGKTRFILGVIEPVAVEPLDRH